MGNYAYIDSNNIYLGLRELGWKIDYRRFRRYLSEKYNVETAYYFKDNYRIDFLNHEHIKSKIQYK